MGWGILGGGSSKSESNQTTYEQGTQFTEQGDINGGQQLAVYGNSGTLTLTDQGAVSGALSLAEKSIGSVETASGKAIGAAVDTTKQAINKVVASAESETGKLITKIGIFGVLGLVGVVVAKRFT